MHYAHNVILNHAKQLANYKLRRRPNDPGYVIIDQNNSVVNMICCQGIWEIGCHLQQADESQGWSLVLGTITQVIDCATQGASTLCHRFVHHHCLEHVIPENFI